MHLLNYLKTVIFITLPLVTSIAINLEKRAPAVTLTLSSVEGSVVKAILENTGDEDLKLLRSGSFLDSAPVEKATVSKDGGSPSP